ncbi:hypothetical protein Tco_0360221 [Tanacetum coccineum]
MAAPPSPNHVFNFSADEPHDFDDSDLEFEEDPQEEFEVDPQEDPEEEPEEDPEKEPEEDSEMEVDDEANWDEEMNEPHLNFPYEEVGSPKPPPPESSDSETEMTAKGDHVQRMAREGTHVENIKLKTMPPRRLKRRAVERMVQKRGVVGLTHWFEKMEQVFEISKCAEEAKVKFAACTFESRALTWWNEIKWKLWTMIVKGDDIEEYNNRFHELALMCPNLVKPEKKKIERYIRGLPKKVKANVTSLKPTSLHDAINMARELIEQAIQAKATRIGERNSTTRGREKVRAAAKNKGSKASGSSTMNDNALARLVVNELTAAKVQQCEAFIEIKRREVECREREVTTTEYRAQQEDIRLYL